MCGLCTRKRPRRGYDVLEIDITYGDGDDVFWHLCRTFVEDVDGVCWYVNEARASNRKASREPNACIESGGFDADGDPVLFLRALVDISAGSEILIIYQ